MKRTFPALRANPASSLALAALLILGLGLALTISQVRPAMAQHDHGHGAEPARVYSVEAVVEAVDAVRQAVTLRHGPIPQVGWDAMTMPFRVDDPALLEGLAPGDEIVADIRFQGQDYSVIDLEKR